MKKILVMLMFVLSTTPSLADIHSNITWNQLRTTSPTAQQFYLTGVIDVLGQSSVYENIDGVKLTLKNGVWVYRSYGRDSGPLKQFCYPRHLTSSQMIQLAVNDIKIHPKIWDKILSVEIVNSLSRSFPCR